MSLSHRNITVDFMRTLAIMLMIIFHFIYNLNYLGVINVDIPDGPFWVQFRWVIITLFFLCVGISLRIVQENDKQMDICCEGIFKTATAALVISCASYLVIPENWIFFGMLHFITISYAVGMPLARYPKTALVIGGGTILFGIAQILPSRWPFYLMFEGLPTYTNDYVPIFPWFGVVLLGIYIGKTEVLHRDIANRLLPVPLQSLVVKISRGSLVIYLVHQAILFGAIWGQ